MLSWVAKLRHEKGRREKEKEALVGLDRAGKVVWLFGARRGAVWVQLIMKKLSMRLNACRGEKKTEKDAEVDGRNSLTREISTHSRNFRSLAHGQARGESPEHANVTVLLCVVGCLGGDCAAASWFVLRVCANHHSTNRSSWSDGGDCGKKELEKKCR